MARSLNRLSIIGNLGGDPEVKTVNSGDRCVSFSVATSESWKDKSTGEKRERTQWHRVTAWGDGVVDYCDRYLQKGSKVLVEGPMEYRKWTDKDGVERQMSEVVIRGFGGTVQGLSNFRDSDEGGSRRSSRRDDDRESSRESKPADRKRQDADMDDEIPF